MDYEQVISYARELGFECKRNVHIRGWVDYRPIHSVIGWRSNNFVEAIHQMEGESDARRDREV